MCFQEHQGKEIEKRGKTQCLENVFGNREVCKDGVCREEISPSKTRLRDKYDNTCTTNTKCNSEFTGFVISVHPGIFCDCNAYKNVQSRLTT